jgi:hypothetical protein
VAASTKILFIEILLRVKVYDTHCMPHNFSIK